MRIVNSKLVRVLAVMGLTAGALVAGTGPAAADANYWFETPWTDYPSGFGVVSGSVTFVGIHRVVNDGMVTDHCDGHGNGDGFGAYVKTRVLFGDGSYSTWTDWQGDSSGCDDGTPGFVHNDQAWGGRKILRLELQLCLRDGNHTMNCVGGSWRNQYA